MVSRKTLWDSHRQAQIDFYGGSYRPHECPCYECGGIVVFHVKREDSSSPYYWVKGHVMPASRNGGSSLCNLRITCYECNNGRYKELYPADRCRLKTHNEASSMAVYEGYTSYEDDYREHLMRCWKRLI
jgi:5-methylcytosine-specific restriction endonuclease McrA